MFTTLHLAYEREAGEILGIPDTVTQAALIPVAYTIGDDFKPAKRRPVEKITYWNAWKQTDSRKRSCIRARRSLLRRF